MLRHEGYYDILFPLKPKDFINEAHKYVQVEAP